MRRLGPASCLTGQEEDDDEGVDDGEPVYLDVAHAQIYVPPARPAHVRQAPLHRVQEQELRAGGTDELRALAEVRPDAGVDVELQLRRVDGMSLHLKSNYSKLVPKSVKARR